MTGPVGAPVGAMGVLVVDDNPDFRLLVRLALAGREDLCLAGEAVDAPDAVRLAGVLHPDVVLLDASLSGPGPVALAGELRSRAAEAVVVLTSARPGTEPLGPGGAALPVVSKGLPPTRMAEEVAAWARAERSGGATETAAGSFPAALQSAAGSRALVRQALSEWGTPEDVMDTAVLLTSEAVTNAVVHARSEIDVAVARRAGRIRVTVADRAGGVLRRRQAGVEDQSGRGTELIEALSAGWGVERRGSLKRVWFELALPGEEPAGGPEQLIGRERLDGQRR